MATIEDVLRRHGYSLSESAFAENLDALLSEQRSAASVIDMSTADATFILEYSGVRPASEDDLASLDDRSAVHAAAEAARTLSRGDVAALLGVDPSRVSHQVAAGRLYSYPGSNGRPIFPDWQFVAARGKPADKDDDRVVTTVPWLAVVVAAFPPGSHPIAVRTFMTTASQDFPLQGTATSPRDWLIGGGDPTDVERMAATLGEQV